MRSVGKTLKSLLSKRWVSALLMSAGLALAMLVAGVIVHRNWPQFRTFSWRLRPLPLLGTGVVLLLAFGLNASTWHFISHSLGNDVGFWKDIEIYSFSAIIRRLPGTVWQVAGRTYMYQRMDTSLAVPLWGSLWEIFAQFSSGVLLTSAMLVISPRLRDLLPGGAWWLLLLVPVGLVVLYPQSLMFAARRLTPKLAAESVLRRHRVLAWIGLYGLSWTLGGLILFLLTCALSPQTWGLLSVCIGLVSASGILALLAAPIPGGLGIREASLMLLLQSYVETPVAVAAALMLRLLLLVGEMLIALFVLLAVRGGSWLARAGPILRKYY